MAFRRYHTDWNALLYRASKLWLALLVIALAGLALGGALVAALWLVERYTWLMAPLVVTILATANIAMHGEQL